MALFVTTKKTIRCIGHHWSLFITTEVDWTFAISI